MVVITSPEELKQWLTDQPRDRAQVAAARVALRALPHAFNKPATEKWISDYAPALFRAVAIAWAARNFPAHDMVAAARAANTAAGRAADAANTAATRAVAYAARAAAYATSAAAARAAAAAARAARSTPPVGVPEGTLWINPVDNVQFLRDDPVLSIGGEPITIGGEPITMETWTPLSVSDVGGEATVKHGPDAGAAAEAAEAAIWNAISADCQWLLDNGDAKQAPQKLTAQPLWLTPAPTGWDAAWGAAKQRLTTLDPSYAVWTEWYDRRISGNDAAFAITGDSDRAQDKGIIVKLADATDDDFWGKGATHVNTTLQSWIDEARARVGALPVVDAQIPPQNRNAVSFLAGDDGRIGIDTHAGADTLRTDREARDRHAEAVREARSLHERCQGNNAAARLTGLFENYLIAAGESVEGVSPSLLVQRGEKLRQEIAAYAAPDTMLDPVADDILVDLKGWQSAHNMVVGLDPVLMALDTAALGPDVKPALISPDELRQLARDADNEGVLAEGVRAVLEEAADLAPAIPDPTNRRTIWSVETGKNLIIELFSVALNNPVKAALGIVAVGVVVPMVGPGWTLGGTIAAAGFLIKHRHWIEQRLGNTPTWKALFSQLCDQMQAVTPFRPQPPDDRG